MDTLDTLAEKLDPRRFTAMSGKLAALLAYILGTDRWTTTPKIVEVSIDSGGNIVVGHAPGTGGSTGDWFGGTAEELDRNLRRLFRVAGLTPAERRMFSRLRKQRVTDWRKVAAR